MSGPGRCPRGTPAAEKKQIDISHLTPCASLSAAHTFHSSNIHEAAMLLLLLLLLLLLPRLLSLVVCLVCFKLGRSIRDHRREEERSNCQVEEVLDQ